MGGQALTEIEAELRSSISELVQVGPWALGIYVVCGERRNASPVIGARFHEEFKLLRV
jgi:hypothetical protein